MLSGLSRQEELCAFYPSFSRLIVPSAKQIVLGMPCQLSDLEQVHADGLFLHNAGFQLTYTRITGIIKS